jgi:hypothetical protein
MTSGFVFTSVALTASLLFGAGAHGQTGPDLVLQDITATQKWGQVGDIVAYSIGTEICNFGDQPGDWIADSTHHPVIAQNLYRLKDGRMEQLGQSWLKHGFAAINGSACGVPCQNPGTTIKLGVGCSDPYGSGLNGDQDGSGGIGGLGPRSEVNGASGLFLWPYGDQGVSGDAIYKRLQVHVDDVTPAMNPGARYFFEGQYVTFDEAQAGNGANNPSYREAAVNPDLTFSFVGETQPTRDALMAWQDVDPTVALAAVEIPSDGTVRLATKVTDLGGGQFRYDYALHNINSDRSIQRFSVPVAPGVDITNVGFNDVDSHSGEPFELTDWSSTGLGANGWFTWSTASFSANPNANALRWGTTYNFWFEADAPPSPANVRLKLFKPGTPGAVEIPSQGPGAGGIPCGDVAMLQARCQAGNNVQARVTLTDTSHDGETLVVELDGVPKVLTINGNKASMSQVSTPGAHTVSLTDPGSCRPDVVVNCQ